MDIKKHGILQFLFVLLFSFTSSFAIASEDVQSVSAGADQVVGLGDMVSLTGVIIYEENDDDDDKKKHRHKKHGKHDKHEKHEKYKKQEKHSKHEKHNKHHKYDKHKKHNKHRKYKDDDDEDEIVISWVQTAGIAVILTDANTLTPTFVAPTELTEDEILSFTINISDDDGEVVASDTVLITVEVPLSTISGRVTAVDGTELAGVSINVLSAGISQATVTSATNGHFSTILPSNADYVIQFSVAGYANQVVPARSPKNNGSIFLDITMIARGAVQTFDISSDTDSLITGIDGAAVYVTADSFVDVNGALVTGNIDVTVTPVDVSSPATLAAFPGEFSGVLDGAVDDTAIISFGTVEFEFSQNGQALQLGVGRTAGVLLPIYIDTYQDGSAISIGDTIPLWSLNEDTGIWVQEGTGTVIESTDSPTGLAMAATVSHFSWWNCDVSANTAQAIVTVFGPDTGTALIKARTTAAIGWRPNTVETVSAVATPTAPLYIPSNGEVCFWAEIAFDNGSNGTTPETCVNAAPSSLINIDLVSPVAGPVNIITTPAATADVLDVTGYFGFPSTRIQFQPSTYETSVVYSIVSGNLPAGLFLRPVNATRAEISGIVSQPGIFNVVVQARDADGNTDTVTINYTAVTSVPPPILEQNIEVFYNNVPLSFDMNLYNTNTGGQVTSWALSFNPLFEQSPPPPGLILDPVTGILTVTDYCIFWDGLLIASNSSGSAEVSIYVEDGGCH